jgi:hypothetical protein
MQLKQKDLAYLSGLNVMFLIDYGYFTNDDLKWNNFTFTWHERIQPIMFNTEIRLAKEKEFWIMKLREKRGKLSVKLSDCFNRVKEFKFKDKIADAEIIAKEIKGIGIEIEEFLKEVCSFFLFKSKFIKCIILNLIEINRKLL